MKKLFLVLIAMAVAMVFASCRNHELRQCQRQLSKYYTEEAYRTLEEEKNELARQLQFEKDRFEDIHSTLAERNAELGRTKAGLHELQADLDLVSGPKKKLLEALKECQHKYGELSKKTLDAMKKVQEGMDPRKKKTEGNVPLINWSPSGC